MKKNNLIQEKSFQFSLDIIKLYKYLKEVKEFDIARQVLRSGTSIGANIEEALGAQSKRDFLSKKNISLKEARETYYWLRLLKQSDMLPNQFHYLLDDNFSIINILSSIVKTIKEQLNL
ncbi:MAG: four helix bundle protein [Bacteroidales bacterium]|nr:four helix bundle protein [Bacteroidales bacterium]